MFLLSSDYDGTLKTRIIDLKVNIREIEKFRSLGNIFILNTGRPFTSICREIRKFNISFDYLCCNDGAVIFNDSLDVVKETTLTNDQLRHIKSLVPCFPGLRIFHYFSAKEILNKEISTPIEIEVMKDPEASFDEFQHRVMAEVEGVESIGWKNSLFVKTTASKSKALVDIAGMVDPSMDPKTIYTVGDEPNDLDMIKNHHGFRMLESSPKLWTSTWRVLPEVHYLVKYLNFKSKRTR
jgi:HAD superfamily hydrolase (TIGR01484 family)